MTRRTLLYIFLWDAFIIGGCAYVVFWRDASGWWFLLALLLCVSSASNKGGKS